MDRVDSPVQSELLFSGMYLFLASDGDEQLLGRGASDRQTDLGGKSKFPSQKVPGHVTSKKATFFISRPKRHINEQENGL